MDFRELWGASPIQGVKHDLMGEEAVRLGHAALASGMVSALPCQITEDSPDGHTATLAPTVRRAVNDPVTGKRTYEDVTVHPDVPVHYPSGGGLTLTHPLSVGDEGTILYLSRNISSWHQSGGSQQPMDTAINHPGDSVLLPGVRSDPRKLQQVATDAMHARDEAKHAVHEVKPGVGVRSFHADPSTPPASASYDPLSMATKYVHHLSWSGLGAIGEAVDGDTKHNHGSFHGVGSWLQSFGGKHKVLAGVAGAVLSAFDGQHTVNADASGVQISSASGVSISCPPGTLSLPAGGIPGGAVQTGGDLSGTADQAEVTSLAHVDARSLPLATSDVQAAAAGVPVGGLYRDTSIASGKTVLVMRAA